MTRKITLQKDDIGIFELLINDIPTGHKFTLEFLQDLKLIKHNAELLKDVHLPIKLSETELVNLCDFIEEEPENLIMNKKSITITREITLKPVNDEVIELLIDGIPINYKYSLEVLQKIKKDIDNPNEYTDLEIPMILTRQETLDFVDLI